jgi:hypothetical protein
MDFTSFILPVSHVLIYKKEIFEHLKLFEMFGTSTRAFVGGCLCTTCSHGTDDTGIAQTSMAILASVEYIEAYF